MEITINLFNKASAVHAQPFTNFQSYFQTWGSFSPADIVNGKADGNRIHEIWSAIQSIKARLDYPQHTAAAINELAEIAAFLHPVFKKAFDDAALPELLIFLRVYSILVSKSNTPSKSDLTINYFITSNNIPPHQIDALVEKVFELVKMFQATLSVPVDLPFSERKMFDDYNAGVKDWELAKAYKLVQGIERGKGIRTSDLIEQMYSLIFTYNTDHFADLLRMKTEPVQFISTIQWMSKNELAGLSSFIFSNPWLLFEILRQLSNAREKQPIAGEIEAGAIFLAQINSISKAFYFQVLEYFKSDPIRNASIGLHMSRMSPAEWAEVVENCFHFEVSNNNSDAKYQLLHQFAANTNTKQLNDFLKLVFDKWIAFVEALEHDQNNHAINLPLTDYADFIVRYQINNSALKPLNLQVESNIQAIIFINEKWFKTQSARNNYFFACLSKLYLLSFAVAELSKTGIKTALGGWDILYQNQIIRSVFLKSDQVEILEVINQNFN